ncbi:MAG: hypothetical protein DRP84_01420 [Spirochaetes bacterium]|nr:MAG: hypothetical protein DRP84_01420 [Spirochaetota bacterium]
MKEKKEIEERYKLDNIRVGLVFPQYKEYLDTVSLPENKLHLGLIPPLSLAYVAALLENAGCEVKLIDASALNLTKEETSSLLKDFRPDFLGFTSSTIDFHCTLSWINYLKRELNIPTIIGGIHLSVYPQETMSHESIDYAVIGEAERTLPELLSYVSEGKSLRKVKGIAYRDNGEVVITEAREPVEDLDIYPFPARHLLPNDLYYSFISKEKKFTAMLTSRGCSFNCIFCDNKTIKYRARSARSVVDEMEECHIKYGTNEIDIFDALFSIDENRVIDICREIKRRGLKIKWSFRTRVDLVNEGMLDELKSAGCIRIYYGIESGDDRILRNINKHIEIDRIRDIVKLTKKKGIGVLGYFMLGNLGETQETIDKTLKLMLELPLDYIQISPVFAPPNTALYEMTRRNTNRDYWREYTLDTTLEEPFPRFGTELSLNQIDKYVYTCYLKFYLRLSYILKFILKIRSMDEFLRSFYALKDMIFSACSVNKYKVTLCQK